MIVPASPREARVSRRQRGRRRANGRLLAVVAVATAFAVGVAFGQALGDNPEPGGTTTSVRTLKPLPLGDARTVTVTVAERDAAAGED